MELTYRTRDGRFEFKVEGKEQTDLFEQLAQFMEVFENTTCTRKGKTSDNTRFLVREDDEKNKYYEIVCQDQDPELRNAKLAFGCHKKGGTLFPKRKDKDGKWLPNNGWVIFGKDIKTEESPSSEGENGGKDEGKF
jgi:hypothetical protein